MNRIKNLFLAFVATLTFAMPALVPVTAYAQSGSPISEGLKKGCESVAGTCTSDGDGEAGIKKIITGIIKLLTLVIGALAVFMVIFGGFKYLMSGGDSGKVTEAKNTILYALLGLAVVIFARALVSFALNQANSAV
jgi:Type IV secretion system pilin